jgi:hypothetical protein
MPAIGPLPIADWRTGKSTSMSTAAGILIVAVSLVTVALVGWMFVWAARKDGEHDRAVQRRLGRRRRTRLGR